MSERMNNGTVFWITGLPGSGKTTIANAVVRALRDKKRQPVLLDGDDMRTVLNRRDQHDRATRLELAGTYARLAHLLAHQGFDVVCATVSLFHTIHEWNRLNLPNYFETYLHVPLETLIKRNQKSLYSRAAIGVSADVPGINQVFEEPQAPDLVVRNDGNDEPDRIAQVLIQTWIKRDTL